MASTPITPINNDCSVAGLLRSTLLFLWNFTFLCQGNKKGLTEKILSHLNSEKGNTPRNWFVNKSKFVPSGSISINLKNIIDVWHFLYEPFCSSVTVIATHCHKIVSAYLFWKATIQTYSK